MTQTESMIISSQNINKDETNIYINGHRLDIEDNIKYLSVIIDDKLQFSGNIDYLCLKKNWI